MTPSRPHRLAPWSAAAAVGLAVVGVLLLPGLSLAAHGPTTISALRPGPQNASWASYPSGGIQVIFPSTLPQVNLVDASNSTLGAVLQVDGILELQAGGLPHPTIVAAAFPMELARFNSTPTANASDAAVSQVASLDVHNVGASLWSSSGVATYLGAEIGSAALFLNYTVLPSASGIAIQWSVVGWPWASPTDLLALELHLGLTQGGGVTPCTGTPTPGALPATCANAPIPTNGITWDPTITSVVASGPYGDSAALAWNPSTTSSGSAISGMVVGTFAPWNSAADVVLAAPADGSASLSGALSFSLFPPPAPIPAPPPAVLRGEVLPYVAVLVGSALLAGLGVGLYRRRERRIRDEL
jgi:hypothetical protein